MCDLETTKDFTFKEIEYYYLFSPSKDKSPLPK